MENQSEGYGEWRLMVEAVVKRDRKKSMAIIGVSLTQYFRDKEESNDNMLTAVIMMLFKFAF